MMYSPVVCLLQALAYNSMMGECSLVHLMFEFTILSLHGIDSSVSNSAVTCGKTESTALDVVQRNQIILLKV